MHRTHGSRVRFGLASALLVVVVAGCGSDDGATPADPTTATASSTSPSPSDSATTRATQTPRAQGTTISTAPSDFGQVLWGPDQQVVYIWELEPTSTAECYGDCAEAWPPVLTTAAPVAAGEVDGALLGTTPRQDGSTQVTYNGHPLYYYAHEGPGEVKCHNVATHGGLWWVITPEGDRAG